MGQQTETFRSKLMTSAKFLGMRFFSNVGLRLVSTVVLSRLLAPEVYGVFAIVLVYMYFMEMLSDVGLRSLILTREEDVSVKFLRTCWTISILRGLAILIFSVLLALLFVFLQTNGMFALDSAYAAPVLPYALAALGVVTAVTCCASPQRFMKEREMAFGLVAIVDIVRNATALVVTIVLAYHLRSVWALVIGQGVKALMHVILSFVVFKGPGMKLTLDRPSLQIVIARGKWVLGQSVLSSLSQSFDRIFLGLIMSSSTFGLYYIARQLVDMVPQFLKALNGAMILQVFKKLHQSTLQEFRRNYYRYRLLLDGAAGMVSGGLIVLSPLVVEIVFDDRYKDVAPIMQVITLGILMTGMLVLGGAFTAARRFHVATLLSLMSVSVLMAGLSYAVFVADSVDLALYVIALHRLPEALLVTALGWRNGWVTLWRESVILLFFGGGVLLGWSVRFVWRLLL